MTATAMEQLYQQVILDHAKDPCGYGLVPPHGDDARVGESHQVNTTCGDELTLRVEIGSDGTGHDVLRSVSWEGQGCSISRASVSVLSELVTDAPVAQAEKLGETFRELMRSRGLALDEAAQDALGDATAFTGVGKFPARIKCALLGWAALRDAIVKAGVGDGVAGPDDGELDDARPDTAGLKEDA
ncbi:Fe-S cluster assembly sulfur transfer protein SufU [Cellulomonas sp. P24]|uniref:Fe-S cluster assembly sulfur transfer protein SufU n=1 Tax=Cellulomonas sp. P24 TaxID=2885206 RepID=UPI00286FF493|nr:SUF system NifU family Fe-S cluster assembly protein [Cellulomonas sp. P24]MCR6491195.1 SUF system NifU family Fe-S cluster assembly protein [Cellulomonas sp. P24]